MNAKSVQIGDRVTVTLSDGTKLVGTADYITGRGFVSVVFDDDQDSRYTYPPDAVAIAEPKELK